MTGERLPPAALPLKRGWPRRQLVQDGPGEGRQGLELTALDDDPALPWFPYADGFLGNGSAAVMTWSMGVWTRRFLYEYPARVRLVGVHFKPWGISPFAGIPATELRDRWVPTDAVWQRSVA